jgi:hypothetical protein
VILSLSPKQNWPLVGRMGVADSHWDTRCGILVASWKSLPHLSQLPNSQASSAPFPPSGASSGVHGFFPRVEDYGAGDPPAPPSSTPPPSSAIGARGLPEVGKFGVGNQLAPPAPSPAQDPSSWLGSFMQRLPKLMPGSTGSACTAPALWPRLLSFHHPHAYALRTAQPRGVGEALSRDHSRTGTTAARTTDGAAMA